MGGWSPTHTIAAMPNLDRNEFIALAERARAEAPPGGGGRGTLVVPLGLRLLADQLTPVLAYRRLVAPDERTAPSFLLESVENGDRLGRHSILGSRPVIEVVARGRKVTVTDRRPASPETRTETHDDPADALRKISTPWTLARPATHGPLGSLPACIWGGWFGYAAYDTVRYAEPDKLNAPPPDDRNLPELSFGYYDGVVVFDHVDRLVHVVQLCHLDLDADDDAGEVYDRSLEKLRARADEIQRHSKPLPAGVVEDDTAARGEPMPSNTTPEQHAGMVAKAKDYIAAGDIFQVVVGQRFEKKSTADPFDVYRSLRAVNPSPYMVYMQAGPCILVASSPEILCRVERVERGSRDGAQSEAFMLTNRPLAGTRKRGRTPEEDLALERELLADEKERAEHIMLVDLGRNDVGLVCEPGTIELADVMSIERYSHVMHISSTVTGLLRSGMDCWDALRATLPVGTISGAPKIRAMQIIDELEPVRRGPYGGGMGAIGLDGQMDIALALRTIVVPVDRFDSASGEWTYHVQAAGGIVADSEPHAEYMETVNKAAALGRAIDLAERAFANI